MSKIKSLTDAAYLANDILNEIITRCGFRQTWDECGKDVQEEIGQACRDKAFATITGIHLQRIEAAETLMDELTGEVEACICGGDPADQLREALLKRVTAYRKDYPK